MITTANDRARSRSGGETVCLAAHVYSVSWFVCGTEWRDIRSLQKVHSLYREYVFLLCNRAPHIQIHRTAQMDSHACWYCSVSQVIVLLHQRKKQYVHFSTQLRMVCVSTMWCYKIKAGFSPPIIDCLLTKALTQCSFFSFVLHDVA